MTVDEIKEAEDMRIWEEFHKGDPKAQTAIDFLKQAVKAFESAEKFLKEAANAVEFTTEADRIESLNMDTENIECDIRAQIERMK